MENAPNELQDAVAKIVDNYLLSDYKIRLNLVLRLESEENDDQPKLVQDSSGTVYSLMYPFTGLKIRLNPEDAEPVQARGYIAAHLIKVFGALAAFSSKNVMRIGEKGDVADFYRHLGRVIRQAAVKAMPDDVPQLESTAELTTVEEEDGSVKYIIDVFFVYTASGTIGFENVVKWVDKIAAQREKFTLPFLFTIAVPIEDLDRMMGSNAVSLFEKGFTYNVLGKDAGGVPQERTHCQRLFGSCSGSVRPHGLFQVAMA